MVLLMANKNEIDSHFLQFMTSLNKTVAKYEVGKNNWDKRQKEQIEELISLERKFQKILVKSHYGDKIYKKFLNLILEEKRNILYARSFFRERKGTFEEFITPCFKTKNFKKLRQFDINYSFIVFVLGSVKLPKNGKLMKIYNQIIKIRTILIESNMPLVVLRARMFWKSVPRSHLSYMDLIQTGSEGMISAIDKYVLPYSTVFRSVLIGYITSRFMEKYSATSMHFFPTDKRKLYRANKMLKREEDLDYNKISREINRMYGKPFKTSPSEIVGLLTATSLLSIDSTLEDKQSVSIASVYPDTNEKRPDVNAMDNDLHDKLLNAISLLGVFEQKILKLKGIEF